MTHDSSSLEQIHRHRQLASSFAAGVFYYVLTSLVVFAGVWFGTQYLTRQPHQDASTPGYVDSLCNWDGIWYARIASDGYFYTPARHSSVAFFPAYPIAGRLLTNVTGMRTEVSLLVVSNGCLILAFGLLAVYVCERIGGESIERVDFVLLAMGFWPTTLFFRMAYSEALFVLLLIIILRAMLRGWHPLWIAVVIGLATACRPVGVALVVPFIIYLWRYVESKARQLQQRPSLSNVIKRFAFSVVVLAPITVWGIAAYIAYQQIVFGDALAFAKTQDDWAFRTVPPLGTRLWDHLILKPIWSVYDPNSIAWWRRYESVSNPLFSLQFMNPIFFVVTSLLIVVGIRKRWLNAYESSLSVALLFIPYISHSYRTIMMAQGRYAASVFPVYIVLGHLAYRTPRAVAAAGFGISAFLLGAYSALFAAWYRFI